MRPEVPSARAALRAAAATRACGHACACMRASVRACAGLSVGVAVCVWRAHVAGTYVFARIDQRRPLGLPSGTVRAPARRGHSLPVAVRVPEAVPHICICRYVCVCRYVCI